MPMTKTNLLLLSGLLAIATVVGGCAGGGRYDMADDTAPKNAPDVTKVENAQPRYEPYSRHGNRRYTVLGKTYDVMPSGQGYSYRGVASWYGAKFHGHLTSNGERYDMYSMTAAHKTLPLPSYVKVTNLDNQKQVIVRVNDRGPFHGGRIIDLSYAAAAKLDMLKTGTANVQVEAIYISSPQLPQLANLDAKPQYYIQLLASQDKARLVTLANELEAKHQLKSRLQQQGELYRLQLGPVGQHRLAEELLQMLRADGYPQSFLVMPLKAD
ncbi:MAG: septal ring lytic transglycosylase RlpA family protein [Shewanella sp.]|nr:septal ring lytic transglycosylase RlpA family protein [Shewanella sp.]MCF1429838.1 septal ring lytic transglycosylase RlpA family protein [Shewanella sp.]MCF1437777.1 septal ring lytic transglycosylase RlpA family protein [Shewanella sp.]MCF1458200.1 septal ring lytic transglycosylase RlpA family protein [Shewanella sp.]